MAHSVAKEAKSRQPSMKLKESTRMATSHLRSILMMNKTKT